MVPAVGGRPRLPPGKPRHGPLKCPCDMAADSPYRGERESGSCDVFYALILEVTHGPFCNIPLIPQADRLPCERGSGRQGSPWAILEAGCLPVLAIHVPTLGRSREPSRGLGLGDEVPPSPDLASIK